MSALSKRVGRRIATRRRAIGWAQADLAERAGIAEKSLGRIERGAPCSLLTLDAIRSQLVCSFADLLDPDMAPIGAVQRAASAAVRSGSVELARVVLEIAEHWQ